MDEQQIEPRDAVPPEEQSATERRLKELGLGEFFWNYIGLERRVDDLESTLAHVLQDLVEAETREERLAAIEIANALPTIAAHRQRLTS